MNPVHRSDATDGTLVPLENLSNVDLVFEAICDKYRKILLCVVESRMDSDLAQRIDPSDVVQEALLEAFTRMADFQRRKPMPLGSWLRETAIQQLGKAVRRHRLAGKRSVRRQVSWEQSSVYRLAEQVTAVVNTAQDHHEKTEEAARTLEALGRLSPLDREILMLRYVNGLANQDVAQVLDVSETVASKRHCRALVRLHDSLK
jgi:RNA polymerase sigma-70 factor, ECF subfamily